jgi:fermentation-respiration switch protein FrsA (DUF1100 family)
MAASLAILPLHAALAQTSAGPSASAAPHAVATSEAIRLDTPTGTLAGTLELPATGGPYPVVLIIAGSGPTDRDGNSPLLPGANNSLKLLAEGLAARGIASVRYDKRGIGESKGALRNEADVRFETFVDDATAWVQRLRADRRFSSVAIVGHSEGSLIGIVVAKRGAVDAVISIAGMGRPFGQVLRDQLARQLPPDLLKESDRIMTELSAGRMVDTVPPALAPLFRPSVQPYIASLLRYDPSAEVARLTVPVLIAQGTTDIQVGVAEAELLARSQPKARLLIVAGMNHVLKLVPAEQGAQMRSYGDSTLPVAPELIDSIGAFISARR